MFNQVVNDGLAASLGMFECSGIVQVVTDFLHDRPVFNSDLDQLLDCFR